MKLAEAQILRADLRKRTRQLRGRLLRNAKVLEGDEPIEQPEELLLELERVVAELELITRRVMWTNCRLMFDADHTISDAIAMRDTLDLRIETLRLLIDKLFEREFVFRRHIAVFDPAALQKQFDDLTRERRDLDVRLQALNWQEDLLEPNY
jgi:hypothetical protein